MCVHVSSFVVSGERKMLGVPDSSILDLRNSKLIGERGARQVIDTLSKTDCSLILRSNRLGVEGISILASNLRRFAGLAYLDLSYNDLNASVFVDPDGPLPEHLFVAGNPMCENVAALGASWQRHLRVVEAYEYPEGCHKQCAKGCWDMSTVGDYCNAECNVTNCHFDGGACLGSESCIRLQ